MEGLRDELSQFAELVVRDYLKARELEKTLHVFDEECAHKNMERPSVESWYNLSQSLNLPGLLNDNANQEKTYPTILEVLLRQLLASEAPKNQLPAAVKIHSSVEPFTFQVPHTSVPTSKPREFPQPTPPPLTVDTREDASMLPSGSLGEYSASPKRSSSGGKPPTPKSGEEQVKRRSSMKRTPTKLNSVRSNRRQNETANLRQSRAGVKGKSDDAFIPMDVKERMFERNLAVVKKNFSEDSRRAGYVKNRQKHQGLSELEQNKAEENFKLKRKKKCGLCYRSFSVVNIVLSVTGKAIVDMQNTWAEKNSWIHVTDAEKKQYQNPTKQCAHAIYDAVGLCVYCAQFFQHDKAQDFYRLTYERKMMEKKRIAEEHTAKVEKDYWDPLKNSNARKE